MKYFFGLSALLLSFGLAAQKRPFEGRVEYRFHGAAKRDTALLTVYFAPSKILLRPQTRRAEAEEVLVDLDSGYVYEIRHQESNYRQRTLSRREDLPSADPDRRTYAGHRTAGKSLASGASREYLEMMADVRSLVVYPADRLYYPGTEPYGPNVELIFVQEGRIVLGAEMSFKKRPFNAEEASQSFVLEALAVVPGPVDPALLRLPAGYTQRNSSYEEQVLVDSSVAGDRWGDSLSVQVDTAAYSEELISMSDTTAIVGEVWDSAGVKEDRPAQRKPVKKAPARDVPAGLRKKPTKPAARKPD